MLRSFRNPWLFLSAFLAMYILSQQPTTKTNRKIAVMFGDSITQNGNDPKVHGWVASFAHEYVRKIDVFNRGYSGYNSKWGLSIIKQSVISLRPDIVTLFWGANDAVVEMVIQHVPLDDFSKNVETMIKLLQSHIPAVLIVLITPPPVDENKLRDMNERKGKLISEDRSNDRTYTYVLALLNIGEKYNLPVVDTFNLCQGGTLERSHYLIDGLHLNELGNRILYKELNNVISKKYPQILEYDMDQPHWSLYTSSTS